MYNFNYVPIDFSFVDIFGMIIKFIIYLLLIKTNISMPLPPKISAARFISGLETAFGPKNTQTPDEYTLISRRLQRWVRTGTLAAVATWHTLPSKTSSTKTRVIFPESRRSAPNSICDNYPTLSASNRSGYRRCANTEASLPPRDHFFPMPPIKTQ